MKAFKFDRKLLAQKISDTCPEIVFALLHGSAKDGKVKASSDIDIAIYLDKKTEKPFDVCSAVYRVVSTVISSNDPDVGVLNDAEPVYRFEALKGYLLFVRDEEAYHRFFSVTCREYESQMIDYKKQKQYRNE